MSARYLGTCGACGREVKVQSHHLAHHGYERPGWGNIVGTCYGSRRTPHELSPDVAKEWLSVLAEYIADAEKKAKLIAPPREPKEALILLGGYGSGARYEMRSKKDVADPAVWQAAVARMRSDLTTRIALMKSALPEVKKRIASWALLPLRTVEEATRARQEGAVTSREAKKTISRDAKAEKAIEFYQERLRRAEVWKIRDVFEAAMSKMFAIYGQAFAADLGLRREIAKRLDPKNMLWEKHGAVLQGKTFFDAFEQKVVIAEEYPVPNIRKAIAEGKFQYAESLLDWVRAWYVKKALRGEIERAKSARHERGENPKVMRSGARIPDSLKARVNVVLGRGGRR